MKKTLLLSCFALSSLAFVSCNSGNSESSQAAAETEAEAPGPYADVALTSDKDPECGMPVTSASAEDTMAVGDQVYGFCCSGCKEEYAAAQ